VSLCQDFCIGLSTCVAVDFNSLENTCWVHTNIGDLNETYDQTGTNQYRIDRSCVTTTPSTSPFVYNGIVNFPEIKVLAGKFPKMSINFPITLNTTNRLGNTVYLNVDIQATPMSPTNDVYGVFEMFSYFLIQL